MQSLTYSQSKVIIDKCQSCEGVWLSPWGAGKDLGILKRQLILNLPRIYPGLHLKNLSRSLQVHKGFVRVKDFLAVLNILKIRIAVEHPKLAQAWDNIDSFFRQKLSRSTSIS